MAEVDQDEVVQAKTTEVSNDVTKSYVGLKPARKPHPNSLANLRPPFKIGERVPGAGRHKRPITALYERYVNNPIDDKLIPKALRKVAKGKTYGELLAIGQYMAAFKGIALSAREIADRLEGKVADRVEVTGSLQLTLAERIARARQIDRPDEPLELTEGEL